MLREVSASFELNRITHVTGSNGAGKTSLMRCIAGYYPLYAGKMLLDGQMLDQNSVTYLGHDNGLKSNLTPYENIYSYAKIVNAHSGINCNHIENLIDVFRLKPLMDIPTYYLSHGQKRRVALAQFFAKPSAVYLLDEPVNGLDTQSVDDFFNYIDVLKKEKIIIMTNHQKGHYKYDDVISLEQYKP